jgi:hypothetical protein
MNHIAARPGQSTRQKRRWIVAGPLWPLISIAMFISLSIAGAVPAAEQQFPQVPLYELLPSNYPHPLARVCYVQVGICDVPTYVFPGAPCACRRADGVWISGVVTH